MILAGGGVFKVNQNEFSVPMGKQVGVEKRDTVKGLEGILNMRVSAMKRGRNGQDWDQGQELH